MLGEDAPAYSCGVSTSSDGEPAASGPWREALERLAADAPGAGRYELQEDLDQGGMGTIHCVWDRDLRRKLAMKRMRDRTAHADDAARQASIGRFLSEAQITSQLDHPGVVPVHDIGLDSEGRLYFTMKLVRGGHLGSVLQKLRRGDDEWSETRVVGVLVRVCEAVAYAHSKGVVHRDLKPANIMVGRFGATYVMDWGLARVAGSEPAEFESRSRLITDREIVAGDEPDSPVVTADGDVLGTPPYMSPEQARGDLEAIGCQSDVYSIGAILYELLTGHMPYVPPGSAKGARGVWHELREGPPSRVERANPRARPELASICDKAMSRSLEVRYASAEELGDDLRRYLEGRVVGAHKTGPLAELRKWVRRNKQVAAIAIFALVVMLVAGFVVARGERRRAEEATRLLAARLVGELIEEGETGLGPIHPDFVDERERWLERCAQVREYEPAIRAELEELRKRALPRSEEEIARDREGHPLHWELYLATKIVEAWGPELESLADQDSDDPVARARRTDETRELERWKSLCGRYKRALDGFRTWSFEDPEDQSRHHSFGTYMSGLQQLFDVEFGLVARVRGELGRARHLARVSVEEWSDAWRRTRDAIRSDVRYRGLELPPQTGLVPIGRDETSGLFEFWHVLSGEKPLRDQRGQLSIRPETGLVLVLVPGGESLSIGSSDDEATSQFDPDSARNERPVQRIDLDPYFIGKHELTQGQWLRVTGANPSSYFAGMSAFGMPRLLLDQPVENVTWQEAIAVLDRLGLTLPTEAQLECAVRGGTVTPRWWDSIPDFDESGVHYYRNGGLPRRVSDGATNPFGLVHAVGNVWEMCVDRHRSYSQCEVAPRTGQFLHPDRRYRTIRGGSMQSRRTDMRSARRSRITPTERGTSIGLRAARAVEL